MLKVEIHIDGACSGNPGAGGFGVITCITDLATNQVKEFHYSEYHEETTNNRMELKAAIKALEIATEASKAKEVLIHSDSQYVVSGINEWLDNWKKSNFKKVKNVDLWKEVVSLLERQQAQVSFIKVKGHSTNEYNNLADSIAVEAIKNKAGVSINKTAM